MFDFVVLFAFVPAAVAIVISPGPDSIYAVTESLKSGRTAGIAAGTGTATGVLVHTTAAVFGLSALLRTTAEAYMLVKYVGAAYLVYLGIQLLRNDEKFEFQDEIGEHDYSITDSYKRGVVINVSNPQVALFVLAFFPQFVPPATNAPLQLSLLGLVYAGISLLYLAVVALFASQVRHLLLDSTIARRAVRYTSGSVLAGFGLKLAFEENPAV